MKNVALIFAGGTGTRMNSKAKPKQFLEIYGKPIIIHTIEHFDLHKEIDFIVVVCVEEWIDYLKEILDKFNIQKVKCVISGGKTALQSQFLGLQAIKDEIKDRKCAVLLHDGVRPLIDKKLISKCIDGVKNNGSAITVATVNETITTIKSGQKINNTVPRAECRFARAPQCFLFDEIYDVHIKSQSEGKLDFIDSCSMMQHYGKDLYYVEGNIENIKITTPSDYYMCKAIIDVKENSQIFGLE